MVAEGRIKTRRGEVMVVLTESLGMPHVTFRGASGAHTIAIPEHFGGAARALGHAEGFIADSAYGETTESAKPLARQLLAQILKLPAETAPAPAPKPTPRVRFDFDQTLTTGYIRVWATTRTGAWRLVASAGPGRGCPRADMVRTPWCHVRAGLPAYLVEAIAAAKIEERALAMARGFKRRARG